MLAAVNLQSKGCFKQGGSKWLAGVACKAAMLHVKYSCSGSCMGGRKVFKAAFLAGFFCCGIFLFCAKQ
jgi:hypothetical protein